MFSTLINFKKYEVTCNQHDMCCRHVWIFIPLEFFKVQLISYSSSSKYILDHSIVVDCVLGRFITMIAMSADSQLVSGLDTWSFVLSIACTYSPFSFRFASLPTLSYEWVSMPPNKWTRLWLPVSMHSNISAMTLPSGLSHHLWLNDSITAVEISHLVWEFRDTPL